MKDITEANLKKYGIDLAVNYQPSDDPPGGSDHRSFVEAGIPIMRFKPGHREEYHTPADEAQNTQLGYYGKDYKDKLCECLGTGEQGLVNCAVCAKS